MSSPQSDIDKFWQYVEMGWDIEPREYFERHARTNGFDSPLAQAAHHIWKRDPKVAGLESELATLRANLERLVASWNTAHLHSNEDYRDCADELTELLKTQNQRRAEIVRAIR